MASVQHRGHSPWLNACNSAAVTSRTQPQRSHRRRLLEGGGVGTADLSVREARKRRAATGRSANRTLKSVRPSGRNSSAPFFLANRAGPGDTHSHPAERTEPGCPMSRFLSILALVSASAALRAAELPP